MGVQLPSEPITRKEQYLAKAAGQAVEVPAEPITREEAYLEAIANAGGGGGGTTNYNQLSNKPQIAGTTLQGNKTLSELGIASESALANKVDKVDGKDLSSNDYSDTEKQKNADNATAISAIKDGATIDSFADVESALSNKQDTLTFDDVPTENSNNPVKSGGIYTALADKQDTLTFDDVPTDNSNNPVKSNGIYDALALKQNATDNSLETEAKTIVGAINEHEGDIGSLMSGLINQTARSRSNITSRLTNLTTAVAEQNLEKYGYKIGDYFTGVSGYTYHLADMDTFYGGYNNNAIVNTHHISLVVKTGANSKWAETNDTSGGYKTSTLHSYLSSTVLDNIKSDMIALFGGSTGLEHLVSHKLLLTTATSAWAWSDNAEYISALSEPQVYGTNVWAIDGYQTGEAWKWLEVFHKFNFCEILGNIWWWLRSISSASDACGARGIGYASAGGASSSGGAVGLIIFH